jgi:hypothetical protein
MRHPLSLDAGLLLKNRTVSRRINGATSSSQTRATFSVFPA